MTTDFQARLVALNAGTAVALAKAKPTGRKRIPGDGDGDGIAYEGRNKGGKGGGAGMPPAPQFGKVTGLGRDQADAFTRGAKQALLHHKAGDSDKLNAMMNAGNSAKGTAAFVNGSKVLALYASNLLLDLKEKGDKASAGDTGKHNGETLKAGTAFHGIGAAGRKAVEGVAAKHDLFGGKLNVQNSDGKDFADVGKQQMARAISDSYQAGGGKTPMAAAAIDKIGAAFNGFASHVMANSDSKDFADMGVYSVREQLAAAYKAGKGK